MVKFYFTGSIAHVINFLFNTDLHFIYVNHAKNRKYMDNVEQKSLKITIITGLKNKEEKSCYAIIL